jgi:hypothetical protein
VAGSKHGDRDWYTVQEVAARFDRTPQAVRVAADRNRLEHDVVVVGKHKHRRFPKDAIDGLERWPGYGSSLQSALSESTLEREIARLRAENARLLAQLDELHTAAGVREMRIESLTDTVERQRLGLRSLADLLSAEPDPNRALRSWAQQPPDLGPTPHL